MAREKHRYVITLTGKEHSRLEGLVKERGTAAFKVERAKILLLADRGREGGERPDREIAERLGCSPRTVFRVRQRFVEEGLAATLERKKREHPPRRPLLGGKEQAYLAQIACSEPPEGCARWTLRLLAARLVELEVVESISRQTVSEALKKTPSSPG